MLRTFVASLFIVGAFFVTARSQGGPPMITDDTGTVPKGHWEINTAFTFERTEDGSLFGTPLLDINYGISKNMQIKVEIPWLISHPNGGSRVNGIGNMNIGVRWRFRDEREHHRIALSMYPQIEFNTRNSSVRRGLVDKGPEFLVPLQIQTQVGRFGINGDVGYRFKRGRDEVIYGVVVGTPVSKRVELLGEIHGTGATNAIGRSEIVYNFGSRVKLTSHVTLILSGGRSIRPNHDPLFVAYTGVQFTF